ncbi:ATP-dependent DNA ligase [Rhodococcus sp. NPDC056960]|uniref:ATP-dependent DNA ligase n=1 Tax=Rhodococcus sp. NPDC056960 TaxID=3345982 RepID=UPI00362CD602
MPTRTVDGHRLNLTHLDKVLYPAAGTTKGEVIDYLAEIAPAMVPHLAQRPVTRKRWPDGVDASSFFERNLPSSTPKWVPRLTVRHRDRSIDYPLIDSTAALMLMGQLAALELHVPQWTVVDGKPGPVTRLVFDLDPGEGIDLPDCARVALAVKEQLDDAGLSSFPVTSGSKGIHVYASLTAESDLDPSSFARTLAKRLEKDWPRVVTATMTKTDRSGKVFVDWSQNNVAKTTVAPYSLRGRAEPTVAAPRDWSELESTDVRQLRFDEVLDRYRSDGDLLSASLDSFRVYRSKRTRGKTPEPVPDATADSSAAASGEALSFVVHEHHATTLHWDFRLEHDGVLVSWAVPKGVPKSPSKNRLAVRTEDHPLDYRTFSGTIPKGQYGGGRVDIFDEGTYVPIKWERDEVLFELRGRRLHGQYVLIHTKHDQWLMHKITKDRERPLPHTESDRVSESATSESTGEKPLPRDLEPMLATLGSDRDLDSMPSDEWSFEGKWDGIRAIAEVADGKVLLHSRTGRDLTATYAELVSIGDALAEHEAVLDGEIVTLDPAGVTSFSALQNRSGLRKKAAIAAAAQQYPAEFYVFDVLFVDGISLLHTGYADRRRVLEELASATGLTVPPRLEGDAGEALAESRRRGWEGIVGKKDDSTYLAGRRGTGWIKVKNQRTQEVIVGGWRWGRGSRADTLGSLLLGIPDSDGLRYVGRVGTGFTEPMLDSLTGKLERLARKTSPFAAALTAAQRKDANWVTPRLVGEVGFTEWTTANLLRHPTWRGLRTDKKPEDVRLE